MIDRAWQVLEKLEGQSAESSGGYNRAQLSLFDTPTAPEATEPHPILQELENIDVNGMTPIQALQFVMKLQEISRETDAKIS